MDEWMSKIQKGSIGNMRMGLEPGQRILLPALSLSFNTIGERTENKRNKSQNCPGKTLLMIAFLS